ncbi:hypothetical protein OS176_02465 [Xanthomonadaceae bacterium XH05]|nr:hypothetical protein [Xanthomonadaceae bacterium XH05]
MMALHWRTRLMVQGMTMLVSGLASAEGIASKDVTKVRLDIYADVTCELSIRGEPAGQVPARNRKFRIWVEAGPMQLACESGNGNKDVQTLDVKSGATRSVRFNPDYVIRFTPEGSDFVRDTETGLIWKRRAGQAKTPADAMAHCRGLSRKGQEGRVALITELDMLADAPLNVSTPCGDASCRVSSLFALSTPTVFADQPTLKWFDLARRTWGDVPAQADETRDVLCVWSR